MTTRPTITAAQAPQRTEHHAMTEHITIPDIERVAATLLARGRATHPVLGAWVRRITSDPSYAETLTAFYPPVDPAERLPERDEPDPDDPDDTPSHLPQLPVEGAHGRESWNDLFFDMRAFPRPPADAPDAVHIDWSATSHADRATYALASAVVSFRRNGRPAGEEAHDLGFGLTLTTSLTAAVAEFARDYADAWEEAFARLQRDGDLPGYPVASGGAYEHYPRLRGAADDEEQRSS